MTIGAGFTELARVAGDYVNGGMNKESAYGAARQARLREANRDKATKASPAPAPSAQKLETPTNPTSQGEGDDTVTPRGGMEVA